MRPDAAHAGVVLEIGPRAVLPDRDSCGCRGSREDAIAVARAVAVLAESATLPAVAALTGLDEGRVADAIGALARAEILRPDLPLGFVHALVRDAVYQELPARRARARSTSRRRACCGRPPRPPSTSPRTCSRRSPPRAGVGWRRCCARRGGGGGVPRRGGERRRPPAPSAGEAGARGVAAGAAASARARRGHGDGPAAVEHLTEAFERLEDPPARAVAAHALGRALLFTGSPAEGAALAERAVAELPEGHRGRPIAPGEKVPDDAGELKSPPWPISRAGRLRSAISTNWTRRRSRGRANARLFDRL